MKRFLWLGVCLILLGGCSGLELEELPTPTWFFTGPTIEPTRSPLSPLVTPPAELPLAGPGQNNPTAAALPANSGLPPVIIDTFRPGVDMVQMTLTGGRVVVGYLYENSPIDIEGFIINARYPGVLLLGAPVQAWGDFPQRLLTTGHSILIVEEESLFIEDFQDIFASLQVAGTVDPGAMAVIGAEGGADIALAGCAVVLGCDAVVLLSPSATDAVYNAMRNYTPRPAFLAASNEDTGSYQAVQTLYQLSDTTQTELALLLNAGRGVDMLINNEQLPSNILDWLGDILLDELTPLSFEESIPPIDLINPDLDAPIGGFDIPFDFDLNLDDEDF
jgi:hypothetical protein